MPASTLGIGSEHMFLQCGRSVSMPASQKPFFNALLYRALLYHSSMWTPRHVVHRPPAHHRLPGWRSCGRHPCRPWSCSGRAGVGSGTWVGSSVMLGSNPLSPLVLVFIDLSFKSIDLSTKSICLPVEIGFWTCQIWNSNLDQFLIGFTDFHDFWRNRYGPVLDPIPIFESLLTLYPRTGKLPAD
jgi:hypothetical protein